MQAWSVKAMLTLHAAPCHWCTHLAKQRKRKPTHRVGKEHWVKGQVEREGKKHDNEPWDEGTGTDRKRATKGKGKLDGYFRFPYTHTQYAVERRWQPMRGGSQSCLAGHGCPTTLLLLQHRYIGAKKQQASDENGALYRRRSAVNTKQVSVYRKR